ncbi:flagellar hook protein FlgE, partial [Paraburkholderia sp. SIMBA_053]
GLNLNAQDPLMLGTPSVTAATTNAGTLTTPGATITNTASGTNKDNYTVTFTSATAYTVTDTTLGTSTTGTYTAGSPI